MFNLHEQLIKLQEDELEIQSDFSFEDADHNTVRRKINTLTDSLVVNGEAINELENFSSLECFARDLKHIEHRLIARGIDMLVAGFENETKKAEVALSTAGSDPTVFSQALDRYAFLFQWIIEHAESTATNVRPTGSAATKGRKRKTDHVAGSGNASMIADAVPGWKSKLTDLYIQVYNLLQLPLGRIWNSVPERDTFIGVFTRLAHKIMENPTYAKDTDFQLSLFNVICLWVRDYNGLYGAVTMVTQNLQHYEHLCELMADLIQLAYESYDGVQLADEVLRGISGKEFSSVHDKSGPKNIARFLIKISQLAPRALLRQMGLLIRHLDSEAHIMRSAMVDVVGHLIMYLAAQEEQTDIIKNQIIEYFDVIDQRFRDTHYLVRAKVLQVCQFVCSGPAKFPKRRPRLITMIIGRLEDKASNVRKHSIRALTAMLETHPFLLDGAELGIEHLEESLEKITSELTQMTQLSSSSAQHEECDNRNSDDEDKDPESHYANKEKDDDDNEDDVNEAAGDSNNEPGMQQREGGSDINNAGLSPEMAAKAMHLQFQQRYYRDALNFVYQLQEALPLLTQLLGSTNKSEVMEAIDFFVTAARYRVDGAQEGIRRMAHLIWTPATSTTTGGNDEARGVRAKLLDSYMQLYLTPNERLSSKENTSRITRNLISLTFGATLAELTSFEELIKTLMQEGFIKSETVDKLRSVYAYTRRELPPAQRRGAIIILGMMARARRSIVTDDIDLYLRIGLGSYGHNDLALAKYTCMVLQCLGDSHKKRIGDTATIDDDGPHRLSMDNPIFTGLLRIIEEPRRDPEWFPAAEQALNTIYILGEKPEAFAAQVIRSQARLVKDLIKRCKAPTDEVQPNDESDNMDVDDRARGSSPAVNGDLEPAGQTLVDPWDLTRLLFIVGHIAIKEIVLLETIEAELKQRKTRKEPTRKRRATEPSNGTDMDIDDDEDELNQIAGTTEDEIGDIIAAIRERELLFGSQSLLAFFGPLLVYICKNLSKFNDPLLTVHATAALAKFMCISSSFCEQNLPLLLALLQRAKSPIIRANIAIALGDITVCFNNLIGENVQYLYEPLHDSNSKVKKTTLMVLTHLILNGMVKVKGQLGEMAKCLEDSDTGIADMAKLFFTELASKDNAVYNNLPDIISSLSVGSGAVNEESFGRIMRFLFDFIKEKDNRQTDNVVEKLCLRFRNTVDPRQCRDIAYCLALLPYKSERSLRKLLSSISAYQDRLSEDEVYKYFVEISTKARSQAAQKPEAKALAEEFDAKLKEARARAIGEDVEAVTEDDPVAEGEAPTDDNVMEEDEDL